MSQIVHSGAASAFVGQTHCDAKAQCNTDADGFTGEKEPELLRRDGVEPCTTVGFCCREEASAVNLVAGFQEGIEACSGGGLVELPLAERRGRRKFFIFRLVGALIE